jgi:hypothetical protein
VRHATEKLPDDVWSELADLLADLQPPAAPGGEIQ